MLNNATVPVASGKVIVLSAVGSVTAKLVSKSLAVAPSNIIFPSVIFIELAAPSAVPETNSFVTKPVIPAKVVDVAPSAILVHPIVITLFARLLLAIDDAVDYIVPVSFGRVKVLSPPVASAADNIVSFASAVEPSKII